MGQNDLSLIIRNHDVHDAHDDLRIFLPVCKSSSRACDNACGYDVAHG